MTRKSANIAGIVALLLWSISALLTSYAQTIPPMLFLFFCNIFGSVIFFPFWLMRGSKYCIKQFKIPIKNLLFPMIGIGIYDVFYIYGMTNAPIEEVNLINNLWPVFLIIFSCTLRRHPLKYHIILGAFISFGGVCTLRLDTLDDILSHLEIGHAIGLCAALYWAGYSALTHGQKKIPSHVIPVAFFFNAFIFLLLHFMLESPWVYSHFTFLSIIALGISTGYGYYLWDIGMKHGDIPLLGVFSYFSPLISTVFLTLFGAPVFTQELATATILIVSGILIASNEDVRIFLTRQTKSDIP